MEVGLGPTIRYHRDNPRALAQVYDEFFDELVLGDQLGYSSIWLPEHHFADDAHNPSALPLLAALARQTTRVRLGTYILLLAFHNPILVAEDAAVVDILSGGRLDLAIGAGPMEQECRVFGVPRNECYARTYEALQVIEKCWTEEEFSHHGKYFHFDDVRVTTKPVQQPHPPIYMAAMGPQSAARSAKRGYHLAMAMGPSHNVYVDALEESGRDLADHRLVSGPIGIHIADTTKQAWDEAEEALHAWVSFYVRRGSPVGHGLPPVGELRERNFPFGGMPFMVGSVDEVGEKMRAMFANAPLDEMVLYFHPPGMPTEAAKNAMTLFAEHILPEAAGWGDTTQRAAAPAHH
jgi:alkanesulfonate monooxygenase SsuD/methylene tetrahydromethanopterin reductase-like flavin-dependent oxidoreductase (luciferase family)